jgi:hypothetical protein
MPAAVVDVLEAVEVELDERDLAPLALGARELGLEPLGEAAAVQASRQRVGPRELGELLAVALPQARPKT